MMKTIAAVEAEMTKKKMPKFNVGDTLKVHLTVKEGDKTRIQIFEGICIRRRGSGANASFSVLKETHGDKVEKIFPLYSPTIEKIVVARKNPARRARLYYLKKS